MHRSKVSSKVTRSLQSCQGRCKVTSLSLRHTRIRKQVTMSKMLSQFSFSSARLLQQARGPATGLELPAPASDRELRRFTFRKRLGKRFGQRIGCGGLVDRIGDGEPATPRLPRGPRRSPAVSPASGRVQPLPHLHRWGGTRSLLLRLRVGRGFLHDELDDDGGGGRGRRWH